MSSELRGRGRDGDASRAGGIMWALGLSVVVHFLIFLTPFALFLTTLFALRRERLAVGLPTALIAWAFPAYAIAVTGDFMVMGRFLVPGMAFQTLLLGWTLGDLSRGGQPRKLGAGLFGVGLLVFGALPAWDVVLAPVELRNHRAAVLPALPRGIFSFLLL